MARQVLPWVGAGIGMMVGQPQLGFMIGSLVGNLVDPQIIKGPSLGDGQTQTASEGAFRPIVLGTSAVMGNIIHRGPQIVRKKRERQGKGGPKVETERRYRTFAIRIAEGPIGGVLRIWMDEKLVYDTRPESEIPADSAQFASGFRLYTGNETQMPDPDLEAYMGVGNVNAYRGTAYIVFPNFDLTDFGDRIPQFRFEVASGGGYDNVAIYIAVDCSGSMNTVTGNGRTRWSNARESIITYLDAINEKLGTFGRVDIALVKWGGLDSDEMYRQTIIQRECNSAGIQALKDTLPETISLPFGTSFRAAVADAEGFFESSPRYMRRISVFVTDGEPSYWNGASWVHGPIAENHATEAGNTLLSIASIIAYGFNIDLTNTSQTAKLDNTQGDGVPVLDGSNPNALSEALIGTLADFSDTLPKVLTFLHRRVGLQPEQFNITDLDGTVDGIVFAGDYTVADCIRTLMPVYMFDAAEFDAGDGYKINYVKRGGPAVMNLTADDLVEAVDESVREDALERPRKLHMHFQSPEVGYSPAKATSTRSSPDIMVTGEESISVPVTFANVDDAWRRANIIHNVVWTEVGGTQEVTVSDALLELVPTDPIVLSLRGTQKRMRIHRQEHSDGTLKLESIADRQSAYRSSLTGVPLPKPTLPPPAIASDTEIAVLDLPALNDNHDTLVVYIAIGGTNSAWHGAVVERSLDDGANYETVLTATQNSIMGVLVDAVSDASEHYTDSTNVVRVRLYDEDEIESLTQQQFLSEGGAFALESGDGTWEVLQYRDAAQDDNGEWVLSTLLRGRLNTTTSQHMPGSRFVMLDSVYPVSMGVGMIGQEVTYRATSLGNSPETGTVVSQVYRGESQQEWQPAHILSSRESDNVEVRVVPRHRLGTEDHPVRSVNWQGYRINLSDGTNNQVIETLSDTVTVNVEGWSEPINITATQVNRFTGPGPEIMEQV